MKHPSWFLLSVIIVEICLLGSAIAFKEYSATLVIVAAGVWASYCAGTFVFFIVAQLQVLDSRRKDPL